LGAGPGSKWRANRLATAANNRGSSRPSIGADTSFSLTLRPDRILHRRLPRQSDNRIRISAQLIEAATGKLIWADNLERAYDDVFTLEDEVAARIASNLASRIEGESIT